MPAVSFFEGALYRRAGCVAAVLLAACSQDADTTDGSAPLGGPPTAAQRAAALGPLGMRPGQRIAQGPAWRSPPNALPYLPAEAPSAQRPDAGALAVFGADAGNAFGNVELPESPQDPEQERRDNALRRAFAGTWVEQSSSDEDGERASTTCTLTATADTAMERCTTRVNFGAGHTPECDAERRGRSWTTECPYTITAAQGVLRFEPGQGRVVEQARCARMEDPVVHTRMTAPWDGRARTFSATVEDSGDATYRRVR